MLVPFVKENQMKEAEGMEMIMTYVLRQGH